MLVPEATFTNFTQREIADTAQGSEVLFYIGAGDRQEVDEIARKVKKAGGTVYIEPSESQGWMYGCAFTDPSGHRWNVLYMD